MTGKSRITKPVFQNVPVSHWALSQSQNCKIETKDKKKEKRRRKRKGNRKRWIAKKKAGGKEITVISIVSFLGETTNAKTIF